MPNANAYLTVSVHAEWPVQGCDEETGNLLLRPGFVDQLEKDAQLEPGAISEEIFNAFMAGWYSQRRRAGYPEDPAMERFVVKKLGWSRR
ncbi:MAG: hypothetical protein ACREUA_02790 [Burkholderiales bacterium]